LAAPSASPSAAAAARTPSATAARTSAPSANADFDAPLRIKRLVLARDVEAREPVAASATFASDEADRIYAFVEVENPERAESEIVVTFEPAGGEPTGHVRLRVGPSSRWRTWAFTRGARAPGPWEAVVRSANGDVLARAPFAIES
jgi:predicted secreted protein